MSSLPHRCSPPSPAVTAAGIDHVRLMYHYLDTGDIDAIGSLLDENAQVKRPDVPYGHGREEVVRLHAEIVGPTDNHHIYKIIADGYCVVATGRFTESGSSREEQGPREAEFADFFTLTDEGMLLGYRRFYFVAPT
ncbi:nuclear transport factor 2 family protein [Streptomyces sp. AK02-01A]|uniref:nuclear transport factor 2 family protein n=1 Tax=Streptomyces sp. AK02-01A TaxID=3028648 RepID=UPI0029B0DEFD|nr:nuclear transport factor 2 family protein [Streptomyces sp. AK02-01A]MDX3852321.1 nuclear transport factor 2 family protein [Streptomyces sp. AK02-01A]